MKNRNGFVSNSSSSSFVIIGKEVPASELNEANLDKFCVIGNTDQLELSTELFHLKDREMMQFVIDHAEFFRVYRGIGYTDGSSEMEKSELVALLPEGKIMVETGTCDQNCAESIEELRVHYPIERQQDEES